MKGKRTKAAPKKERKKSKDDWAPTVLARLAQYGVISYACKGVIERTAFYRRRDNDPEFYTAMKAALAQATDALELEARRRAEQGVTRPVMHDGKPVFLWVDAQGCYVKPKTKGAKQVPLIEHDYSDTLLIFLLKAHRPRKFRDRHQVEHTGKKGGPIEYRNLSDAEVDRRIAEAEGRLHGAVGGKAPPPAATPAAGTV